MSALERCLSFRVPLQKMTVFWGMTRHLTSYKRKWSSERGVGTREKCHKLVKQNSIVKSGVGHVLCLSVGFHYWRWQFFLKRWRDILQAEIFPLKGSGDKGEVSHASKTKQFGLIRTRACLMFALGRWLSCRVLQKMTVFKNCPGILNCSKCWYSSLNGCVAIIVGIRSTSDIPASWSK